MHVEINEDNNWSNCSKCGGLNGYHFYWCPRYYYYTTGTSTTSTIWPVIEKEKELNGHEHAALKKAAENAKAAMRRQADRVEEYLEIYETEKERLVRMTEEFNALKKYLDD